MTTAKLSDNLLSERPAASGNLPTWFEKPEPRSFQPKMRLRTVWISDVHLGTAGCQAGLLSDFLHSVECETLYLVGDIVDGWRLRKGWYWPDQHNEVIRRLLKMAHRGTRVIYIPGNHDEMFRDYAGQAFQRFVKNFSQRTLRGFSFARRGSVLRKSRPVRTL